jgi:hypothetical protein
VLAAVAVIGWAVCVGGMSLESGFGRFADFLFAVLLALVGIPLATLCVAILLALLRMLPQVLSGFLAAAAVFVALLWYDALGLLLAALLLLVECSLGAALAILVGGGWRTSGIAKRIALCGMLVLSIAVNVALFRLWHSDGIDEELLKIEQNQASMPAPLAAADPSQGGPYRVRTLYYGSGDSATRPEFGPSVAIRSATVDASPFFKDFGGWKAWLRKRYWGFGMDKLPLNGQVFYPNSSGRFPLFLIVHGNHKMSVASDKGYEYLCELLASRGFIAVSVDENFLNVGLFHDPPKQQAVRGWLLLEHLRLWQEWSKDPKNPWYGKVDLSRIALAGHSRGGEAAATAALFNKLAYYPDDATIRFHYGYAIQCVIAIAPPDGQYKPAEQWRVLKDVNYLTLQGSNDADLASFMGSRQYDHVHFSGSVPAFKAELYIYRANHGQFNTMWGRTDTDAPWNWFLNLRPLLTGDAQRQVAKLYISAFLDATLRGHKEYVDLFRDYRRARQWLPDTLYVNRFQEQSYRTICSFDEDADVSTTTAAGGHISSSGLTVWREGNIPFRDGSRAYNGVFLGWNWEMEKKAPFDAPNYSIDLPPGSDLPVLNISVAATDDDAPEPGKQHAKPGDDAEENNDTTDFSVEAVSANGEKARLDAGSFMPLLPPLHVQLTKWEQLDKRIYKESAEPAFQSLRIPFSAFAKANAAFDPHRVRTVRLIFDKTPKRVIIVSGIGLEGDKLGTGVGDLDRSIQPYFGER